MRRVTYLQQAGFVREKNDHWVLGDAGREYVQQYDVVTLFRIMCERNVGLRSLLYALSAGSMTIAEISTQQLDTHPNWGGVVGRQTWRSSGRIGCGVWALLRSTATSTR